MHQINSTQHPGYYSALLLLSVIICSCASHTTPLPDKAQLQQEIIEVEKDFEKMVAEKGIAEGFAFFADSNAVIKRGNDSLIHGKAGIRNYYSAAYFKTASVKWSPDFVDVAEDSSMAYTYGKYSWQSKDSTGKINETRGVFHTVWKKKPDGAWRYVWD